MSRRIMLNTNSKQGLVLEETLADNEKQLQELIKDNPDLLPVGDLGMKGPLAVIGRETGLPSGAVDLVALSRDGQLVIAEFKTGPKNPDFRAALAQLVDYGSDLWGKDWDSFERDVPLRYFGSEQCHNRDLSVCLTLWEALTHSWDDLDEDEFTALQENLAGQLSTGSFHYALLAQGFTDSVLKTIEYLNEVSSPRFYAIEVVRFANEDVQAFEARLIRGPSAKPPTSTTRTCNHRNRSSLTSSPKGLIETPCNTCWMMPRSAATRSIREVPVSQSVDKYPGAASGLPWRGWVPLKNE